MVRFSITFAAKAAVALYASVVELGRNSSISRHDVAGLMAENYQPNFTIFTLGMITVLKTREDAQAGIENVLNRYNETSLGTSFTWTDSLIEPVSNESAVAWVTWNFAPKNGLAPWDITTVYGYRLSEYNETTSSFSGGFEWVNSDQEYQQLLEKFPDFFP
ncbi:hypothetical protein B0H63DRAFT_453696 [Podospora didyma]|uniref:Uncharacterized protein n=1 Tax=Podospora didyma TaxID=330526 RepID=A0AAE0K930_9PEZI|nr:hypothetical protein B0H63DRAFT_453696 [Podospora didyma]